MIETKYFQQNLPVFVRSFHKPFIYRGNEYNFGQEVPWMTLGMTAQQVQLQFNVGTLYHNSELEKQNKVGDRLEELAGVKLDKLYNLLNAEVKKRTVSTTEYNKKKVKHSKIEQKQRALIRTWLRGNAWAEDHFYELRDQILGE